MAIWRRKPPARPRAQVAAASDVRIEGRRQLDLNLVRQDWQYRALDLYDLIGEINYGASFFGNSFQRIRLRPGELDESGQTIPTEDDDVAEALNDLGGPDEHAALLNRFGIHMFLTGETYFYQQEDDDNRLVDALSIAEVRQQGNEDQVDLDGSGFKPVSEDSQLIRIWRPHPRKRWLATSRMQGIIDRGEELILLSDGVFAAARSRLFNGFLLIAEEIDFEIRRPGTENEMTTFDEWLVEVMTTPIKDKRSAVAFVPPVLRIPEQHFDKVKHITFQMSLDEKGVERREELVKRIAAGLELPLEVLTGMGDTNHWGAWQIEDSTYKAHVEPPLGIVLGGMVKRWLRPRLEAAGMSPEEAANKTIFPDASDLIASPDRTGDAKEALDRAAISVKAYRRETGWSEEDAPDEAEYRQRVGIVLGDPLLAVEGEPSRTQEEAPQNDDRTPREIERGPPAVQAAVSSINRLGQSLMQLDQDLLQRVMVAADAAVSRALERAGSRIRSKAKNQKELLQLLKDSPNEEVTRVLGPRGIERLGLEEEQLLEGAFTSLGIRIEKWLQIAQEEALRAVSLALGLEREILVAETATVFEMARKTAAKSLIAILNEFAKNLLFKVETPTQGEFDDLVAPRGQLRKVLGMAGGLDRGPEGVGNGAIVRGVLGARGVAPQGYRWNYGSFPRNTFPGHLALDGEEFETFTDPILTVNPLDSWLGVSHYHPSDHAGCACQIEQIFGEVPIAASGTGSRSKLLVRR